MRQLFCFLFILTNSAFSQAIYNYEARTQPQVFKHGIVSSQNELATRVGVAILKKGGNAFDAAVAVGFAAAVTLPRAGNLGGGGFMVLYHKKSNKVVAIDYREKAPLTSHRDMYLNEQGNVDEEKFRNSYAAVGVPGTVAGLAYVQKKYGQLSLADVINPAIELAEKGFKVDFDLYQSLQRAKPTMKKYPSSMKIFFKPDGTNFEIGETLVQKDLANTLRLIKAKGARGFYQGEVAKKIGQAMIKNGGLVSEKDLKQYSIKIRKPVQGSYRGYQVFSMPPPSSGGVHLVQMLNMLELYPIASWGHNSAQTIHTLAEVMRSAYADRSKHLGDPDFAPVPVKELISKKYARYLKKGLPAFYARKSTQVGPADPVSIYESRETTHYSVADSQGNAVSNTYTLNFSYGMKAVAEGTGVLLNNEMNDFSAKPGVPNAYGLLGGEKNAVAPGKRMLSSMTPTIVMKDGKPFLITGSPGGSRIITTTLQVILNVIDFKMNIAEATQAVRIHHQWYPDKIFYEQGLNVDTMALLKGRGHELSATWAMGSTQSILIQELFFGASDQRKPGALTGGY